MGRTKEVMGRLMEGDQGRRIIEKEGKSWSLDICHPHRSFRICVERMVLITILSFFMVPDSLKRKIVINEQLN